MPDENIKYLTHPVTPEEKAKWIKKGFRIIDERFNPKPKKTRSKSQEQVAPRVDEPTEENTAPDAPENEQVAVSGE